MEQKERRWLISVIMTLVMTFSVLANPLIAMAAETDGSSQTIAYINSDGTKYDAAVTDDGLVYTKVNSDGNEVVKVLGYRGNGTELTIPEKIENLDVVSFGIDPRWPVGRERYDYINKIVLPKTVAYAHSSFLNQFKGLSSIETVSDNETYKSVDGVLYKKDEKGCYVYAYPRGKQDTSFVMPDDMYKPYGFFSGCPVENITVSKSVEDLSWDSFDKLDNLKQINVDAANPNYYSIDGVLYRKYDDLVNDETVSVKELYRYPKGREETAYTIPEGISAINYYAVSKTNLDSLTLPSTITNISPMNRIFKKLKNVYVSENNEVYSSEDGLLLNKDKTELLRYPAGRDDEEFTLKSSVKKVMTHSFTWSKIKNLKFEGNDFHDVAHTAFNNMQSLEKITFLSNTVPLRSRSYRLQWLVFDYDLDVDYPEGIPGYKEFADWLKDYNGDQDYNYWRYFGFMNSETEFPLGANIDIVADPYYGADTVSLKYSKNAEGPFSVDVPNEVGTWYVKAYVDETDRYTGLESEVLSFNVTDPEEGKAENAWIGSYVPTDDIEFGHGYIVEAYPKYGTSEIYYKEESAEDTEANWTKEKPADAGTYVFKAIVNETEDYTGLEPVTGTFTIVRDTVWVNVYCDNIIETQKPSPYAEYDKDMIKYYGKVYYEGIDLDKITFKYSKRNADKKWEPYTGSTFEPGKYRAESVIENGGKFRFRGERSFTVNSVKYCIQHMPSPARIKLSDESRLNEIQDAYDKLSAEQQAAIPETVINKFNALKARLKALELYDEIVAMREELIALQEEYEQAYNQAVNSKNATEEAINEFEQSIESENETKVSYKAYSASVYKPQPLNQLKFRFNSVRYLSAPETLGDKALQLAKQAEEDARAVLAVADKVKAKADVAVDKAAETKKASEDDVVSTRLDKQIAEDRLDLAEEEAATAGKAVTKAEDDITTAENLVERANEIKAIEQARTTAKSKLDNVNAIDSSVYTDDSFKAVIDAAAELQTIMSRSSSSSEEITAATEKVTDAIGSLKTKEQAEKEEAERKEAKAKEKAKTAADEVIIKAAAINADDYTEDTYIAVRDAKTALEKVIADEESTSQVIEDAVKALNDAINSLKTKEQADKEEAEKKEAEAKEAAKATAKEAITKADALKADDYTEDTYKAVTDAKAALEKVLSDEKSTSADIETATKALNDAIAALREKEPTPEPQPEPTPEPQPEPVPQPADETPVVEKGDKVVVFGNTFTVTSVEKNTVAFLNAKNKKKATIPATVTLEDGKTYKVTEVNAKAFTGKKIKTVVIGKNIKKIRKNSFKGSSVTKIILKTKLLKKASVKGSLKGSKVKTVQIKVGSKKVNKKYVKKYKKIFTKKNVGKKVKIR